MPRKKSSSRQPTPTLNAADYQHIWVKSRALAEKLPFADLSAADLEQDMALEVCQRLPRYNPARGCESRFIRLLVNHAFATVLRNHCRRQRQHRPSCHALVCVVDTEHSELIDPRTRESDVAMLRVDVERALGSLPHSLRRVADVLKLHSVQGAARELGCSRQEVYRKIAELRSAFVAVGLDAYLS